MSGKHRGKGENAVSSNVHAMFSKCTLLRNTEIFDKGFIRFPWFFFHSYESEEIWDEELGEELKKLSE